MLPTLPMNTNKWAKSYKRQQEIVAFRGLNRTQNTQEGEFSFAQNLSTANFPTLTQRGKRTKVKRDTNTDYTTPTDIYAWDGHLVVVDGGILYYDGVAKDNVSAGKKQFAVVNTKLIIWPDKAYIDLTNGSFGHLDTTVQTSGETNSVVITSSTFQAALTGKRQSGLTSSTAEDNHGYYPGTSYEWYYSHYIYTYGTDAASVAACWQNNAWNLTALTSLQSNSKYETPSRTAGGYRNMAAGDIFIPSKTGNAFDYVLGTMDATWTGVPATPPDRSKYNSEGYYGVITQISTEGHYDPVGEYNYYYSRINFDLYQVTQSVPKFSGSFSVGDFVNFSNMPGNDNVQRAKITAISDNTMTFASGTFTTTGTFSNAVTVQRAIPDLDYICEKDNRLWGVSNSTQNTVYNAETQQYDTFTSRAIYASALGDPLDWWTFDGIDSDAYQVAVGSEGDFTGICAYNNAVCCWKEDRLYKILGNYPSEYYMHDSRVEGVGNGSYRSMTVVNEVLYYNGATGVYAYTGSAPTLIGYPLGVLYTNASGGTNGLRWYLSGTKPDGTKELVVYDLTHRIWTREDASDATAFATIGNNLYMLNQDGIFLTEQGDDSDIEWVAEFVAFNETALIRKYYLRLLLRLEMATGSSVTVKVKHDNGDWKTLLNADAVDALVKSVEIPPHRCDKLTVRLEGTGNVLLRHMTREYTVGSEKP